MIRRPPKPPLFPTPTLFRSRPAGEARRAAVHASAEARAVPAREDAADLVRGARRHDDLRGTDAPRRRRAQERSEEHTSELQSPCNLVCRLLLEKKKNHTNKY